VNANHSTLIQGWINRLHAGDESARGELLAASCERLRRLTRKMLKGYPGVRRWEETDDVLQNASLRLCRALQAVTPPSVRDYFRLAAVQIRRELLDLARHYYGPEGQGAHHASDVVKYDSAGDLRPAAHDKPDLGADPNRLAAWCEFHRQINALPDEEREVFELIWYQGLSQAEAAQVLNISERTLQRHWRSARLKLYEAFQGELPGM
jgi:RNA polymerase sigma-70 factor (ECF subfamily)